MNQTIVIRINHPDLGEEFTVLPDDKSPDVLDVFDERGYVGTLSDDTPRIFTCGGSIGLQQEGDIWHGFIWDFDRDIVEVAWRSDRLAALQFALEGWRDKLLIGRYYSAYVATKRELAEVRGQLEQASETAYFGG